MFVDIWIVALFSFLFGACAVYNYNRGITRGIEGTLDMLEKEKIIIIRGDDVFSGTKK
jgi:hypothetical protein